MIRGANLQVPAEFSGTFREAGLSPDDHNALVDISRRSLAGAHVKIASTVYRLTGEGHKRAADDIVGMLGGLATCRGIYEFSPQTNPDLHGRGELATLLYFMSIPHVDVSQKELNGGAEALPDIARQVFKTARNIQL